MLRSAMFSQIESGKNRRLKANNTHDQTTSFSLRSEAARLVGLWVNQPTGI